jgi:hypothetical protein
MNLWKALATSVVVSMLAACAVPMRITLTPQQRAGITELKAHVVVVQDEVIAAVQPSTISMATGGGLLFAAIDSSITNSRVKASQEVLGPFYATIEDVDYRQEFNEAIRGSLAKYPIKVTQFTTTPRALNNAQLKRLRNELQPGQALLVVYPRYFLTMDFRSLDSESIVTMWIKGGDDRLPVQRGVLHYQSQPVGTGGKESVALWSEQNAAPFRAALRESIAETIDMVLLDFDLTATPAAAAQPRAFAFNTGAQEIQIKGQVVKETPNRTTLLGDDKKIYSLPKIAKAVAASQ